VGIPDRKSTVTALTATTHDQFQMLDSGKDVCAVFFDIATKADSPACNHAKVAAHNTQQPPPTLGLQLLSYREQWILVNGATSESLTVICGVPQELQLVLGPLWFH